MENILNQQRDEGKVTKAIENQTAKLLILFCGLR